MARSPSTPPTPRRVPKTRAITATGACGHEFTARHLVPAWYAHARLGGEPLTEQTPGILTAWQEHVQARARTTPCPNCLAEVALTDVRGSIELLAGWLHVDPLPPLDGSTRQNAYGERVRLRALTHLLTQTQETENRPAATGTVIADILWSSLQTRFPGEWLPAGRMSPAARTATIELDEALNAAVTHRANDAALLLANIPTKPLSPQLAERPLDVLAQWLQLRHAWTTWVRTRPENHAQYWIARRGWRDIAIVNDAARSDYQSTAAHGLWAALVTSRLPGWQTLEDAWACYRHLLSPDVAAEFTHSDGPLAAAVETAAVIAALKNA